MSTTSQMDPDQLKKEYEAGNPETRASLERIFGKATFHPPVWELIDDFLPACQYNGTDPNDARFTTGSDRDIAREQLKEIAKALRAGHVLDYSNQDQEKWSPYFRWDGVSSGFRFRDSYCDNAVAYAGGAGLCLVVPDKKTSDHFGSHPNFLKIWNRFLNKIVD